MSVFDQLLLPIIQNLALLMASALILILLYNRTSWKSGTITAQLIIGFIFAIIMIIGAQMPIGVGFGPDIGIPKQIGRSDLILLLMSGVLTGPYTTLFALALTGLFEILPTLSAGVFAPDDLWTSEIQALSFCGGLSVLSCFFIHPIQKGARVSRANLSFIIGLCLVGAVGATEVFLRDLADFMPIDSEFRIKYTLCFGFSFLIGGLFLVKIINWDSARRQHIAILQQSHRAQNSLTSGLLWISVDGDILYANMAASQILGYSNEEFIRRHLRDLDNSTAPTESIRHLILEPKGAWPRIFSIKLRNRDDKIIRTEVEANLVPQGRFDYEVGFIVLELRSKTAGRETIFPTTKDQLQKISPPESASISISESPIAEPGAIDPSRKVTAYTDLKERSSAILETSLQNETSTDHIPLSSGVLSKIESTPPPPQDPDPLTQLYGRLMLEHMAVDIAQRAARREIDNMVIAMIDVDDLTGFNHRRGTAMGDALLQTYARILRQGLRTADRAFRYGDDEFAVLMPGRGEGAFEYLRRRFEEMVTTVKGAGFPDAELTVGFVALSEVNYKVAVALEIVVERVQEIKHNQRKFGKN